MAPYLWAKATLDLPQDVKRALDQASANLDQIIDALNAILVALELLKALIQGITNPLKVILEQLIQQLEDLRDDLLGMGFYVLMIYPDWNDMEVSFSEKVKNLKSMGWTNLTAPAGDYVYDPLQPYVPGGVRKFQNTVRTALYDVLDPNRPMLSDTADVGAYFFIVDVDLSAINTIFTFINQINALLRGLIVGTCRIPTLKAENRGGKVVLSWSDRDNPFPFMDYTLWRSPVKGGVPYMIPNIYPEAGESTLKQKVDSTGRPINKYDKLSTIGSTFPFYSAISAYDNIDFSTMDYYYEDIPPEKDPYFYVLTKGSDDFHYSNEVMGQKIPPKYYLTAAVGPGMGNLPISNLTELKSLVKANDIIIIGGSEQCKVEIIQDSSVGLKVERGVGLYRSNENPHISDLFIPGLGKSWLISTEITIFPTVISQGVPPNFKNFTVEDMIDLRPIFDNLIALVQGILDALTGIEKAILDYITNIEFKIAQIRDIIQTIKDFIDALKNMLAISSVDFLEIAPAAGGVDTFVATMDEAFQDPLAPNSGMAGYTCGLMILFAGPNGSISGGFNAFGQFIVK